MLALPFASAYAASISVQPSSAITVGVGTSAVFLVSQSGFSAPSYSISDSFGGSTVSSGNIDSSGDFNWIPASSDAGVHTITITASDSSGNTASASEQITVVSQTPTLSIQNLSPGTTIGAGTMLNFSAVASGFANPTYTIADSASGSTLNTSDISTAGYLSWTPQAQDVGTHNITVTATDSTGATANVTTSVTVLSPTGSTVTTTSTASGLSQVQVQAILALLQSFGADQGTINGVANDLGGQAPVSTTPSTSATLGDGYVFTSFMEVGDSSDQVTELQTRLQALGYFSQDPTGYFGPVTEAAVEQYQAAHGIDQVGYVGPATRASLNGQ